MGRKGEETDGTKGGYVCERLQGHFGHRNLSHLRALEVRTKLPERRGGRRLFPTLEAAQPDFQIPTPIPLLISSSVLHADPASGRLRAQVQRQWTR